MCKRMCLEKWHMTWHQVIDTIEYNSWHPKLEFNNLGISAWYSSDLAKERMSSNHKLRSNFSYLQRQKTWWNSRSLIVYQTQFCYKKKQRTSCTLKSLMTLVCSMTSTVIKVGAVDHNWFSLSEVIFQCAIPTFSVIPVNYPFLPSWSLSPNLQVAHVD